LFFSFLDQLLPNNTGIYQELTMCALHMVPHLGLTIAQPGLVLRKQA
jgi:hypothetical protein